VQTCLSDRIIAVPLLLDAISQSDLVAKVELHQFNLATEHLGVATVADDAFSGRDRIAGRLPRKPYRDIEHLRVGAG
jgi:hypothetical protein